MNEKMRSSVMGLILGQFSSPLPISQKEPVAYLYNGVRLPKLPEWDKKTFPCALIIRKTDGTYHLRLFRGTSGWGIDNYPRLFVTDDPDEFEVTYKPVALTENGWGDATGTGGYNTSSFQIGEKGATAPTWQVWSNVDIAHKDTGELLLAASDPIPVYE